MFFLPFFLEKVLIEFSLKVQILLGVMYYLDHRSNSVILRTGGPKKICLRWIIVDCCQIQPVGGGIFCWKGKLIAIWLSRSRIVRLSLRQKVVDIKQIFYPPFILFLSLPSFFVLHFFSSYTLARILAFLFLVKTLANRRVKHFISIIDLSFCCCCLPWNHCSTHCREFPFWNYVDPLTSFIESYVSKK